MKIPDILILFIVTLIIFSISPMINAQEKFTYKESDPKKVIDGIFRIKMPEKDEFETLENFKKRIPKMDTTIRYHFPCSASTLYNIEDSTFTISILGFRYNIDHICLRIDFNETKNRTYIASNALGKKVKVVAYTQQEYFLDSINLDKIKLKTSSENKILTWIDYWKKTEYDYETSYSIDINLKLIPEIAKKHSKNINTTVLTKFTGYFNRNYYDLKYEPKINNPIELTEEYYSIKAIIEKIYLYNAKTKEIVAILEL